MSKEKEQVFCDPDKHEWEYDDLRWNRWCIWCGYHQFSRPLGKPLGFEMITWEDGTCHKKGILRSESA